MKTDFILPGRLRKKDGYYHLVIDTVNPITKNKIRHSKTTGLKVIEKTKKLSNENHQNAICLLQDFRKEWTKYYFNQSCNKKSKYFTEYLVEWFEGLKPSLQPNTIESYSKLIFVDIIPYFERKKLLLDEIKALDIQSYYTTLLTEKKVTPNTVLKHHAIIRKCLQTAWKQELIIKNVADLIDRPKKKKYIAKVLNEDEIRLILREIKNSYFYIPVFLSLNYGLRRSEVLGLLWSNIDFENKTIIIANTVIEGKNKKIINRKQTKTRSSYRTLPLTPSVEKFLLDIKERQVIYRKKFGNSYCEKYIDSVCTKENGDLITPQYVTQHFKIIVKKLKLNEELSFHSLRHTFATRIYKQGGDLKMIQNLLGHSCISTTIDTYTHFPTIKINQARDIIDELTRNETLKNI